ncbi:ATP-binding protein [Spirosoma soli]|uniref:histidine kinase n=1 Tax=Spirosoma soli TaxID=1770529 RepID=A0ABW5ME54_9BACT
MHRILLLLLWPCYALAQTTPPTAKGWRELTIADGLSQGMIYDLKQDKHGYIWIATKDGLNRYDGYNFTVFTRQSGNPYSLSDNGCSALCIDRKNRLWVGTLNQGLNLYDDRTGRFYHLPIADESAPNAGNYEVGFIIEDPGGNLWLGTNTNKLFRISLPPDLSEKLTDPKALVRHARITTVLLSETGQREGNPPKWASFLNDGSALVNTLLGTYTFSWRQPGRVTKRSPFRNVPVNLQHADERGEYLFGLMKGQLVARHSNQEKIIPILPHTDENIDNRVRMVAPDTIAIVNSAFLWVMSTAELFRQDSLTSRNALASLPAGTGLFISLLKDRTGLIWLGTNGYGLRYYNPTNRLFQSYLPGASVYGLMVDRQGRTYARIGYPYQQLNRATGQTKQFIPDKPPVRYRHGNLVQDKLGNFWATISEAVTNEQHLVAFSADWQEIKRYPFPPGTAFGYEGTHLLLGNKGELWIGGTNGKLLRFDPQRETFRVISYRSVLPRSGAPVETYALHRYKQGIFWIGTQKGLIRFEQPETKPRITYYQNVATDPSSLSDNFVSSVVDDPYEPQNYLWVATKGGGLNRLDKRSGRFIPFTEEQGLPNKVVYGILIDEFKNLWLSTNRGLSCFHPRKLTFRNYTQADGLQDDEFNTNSFHKAPSGELLFGGVNGLTIFRAAGLIRQYGQKPVARIIDVKVNNRAVEAGSPNGFLEQTLPYTNALELAHDQNLLTVEFGVMNFAHPAQNRYRYRLIGADDDWIEAGTNRFATYTHLGDGQYTLQMMGSTNGEVWSDPVELAIHIRPPFYRTWWAYLVYLLVLAVVVWQAYRIQLQRAILQQKVAFEQAQSQRLAELDALKTQFFANISHEFRTPLTLILGPIQQAVEEYAHDDRFPIIERNAQRLLNLINQLLDLSKLEAGQLRPDPQPGNLSAFLQLLASSFRSLAESRRIQFTFAQNRPDQWASFDRDKLEKIVTNLLANAFKFTPTGGQVSLRIDYPQPGSSPTLMLTIADTGIGIPPDKKSRIFERFYQVDAKTDRTYEGTGIGLALVNELVRVLGGSVTLSSTEGVGTTFRVVLPFVSVTPSVEESPPPAPIVPAYLPESTPIPAVAEVTQENILLVIDDNADIRAYVRSVFEGEYQVLEAEDGQQGLTVATETLPNLVICDLMMPRLDGFGFCQALKSQEATSHIPVVMLTARATVEDRIEGFGLGADDYLTKPFNRTELQARVRNLIRQRQLLYEWFSTRQPTAPMPSTSVVMPEPLTVEHQFLDRLRTITRTHLDDPNFGVETLSEAVNLSRSQLHRKVKALTSTTVVQLIRDVRLERAAELLRAGNESVTQVAFSVGFENLSYFARVFEEQYGVLPSQYGTQPTDGKTPRQSKAG